MTQPPSIDWNRTPYLGATFALAAVFTILGGLVLVVALFAPLRWS